jgi:hypothetical protein
MSLLGHVQHLSEDIGPRGSTTDDENKASDYVEQQLQSFGLHTQRQRFLSATSAYTPFALATGAMLVAVFLFWQPQPVGAAAAFLLGLVVLISIWRELSLRDNPLRWVIPTDFSQNVLSTIPSQTERKQPPILITAHVDTHRMPLLFSSPGWRRLFHTLVPLGLVCMIALTALFAIGIFSDARILRQIALAPGAIVLILFLLLLQAARSPFSKGANDNASGVAVALDLAERLAQQPLQTRDVILGFTGCQEVGGYGVDALISANRDRLRGAIHLVIDHVGGENGRNYGPSVIRSERFLRRVNSDLKLLATADQAAHAFPALDARQQDFSQAYSELSIGAKHGLRVIGLSALTEAGTLPNWHVPGDVIANLSEDTLVRSAQFAWHLLQAIDAEDAEAGA